MTISETQLETWSKQGSVAQSRDTYATVKSVLETSGSPYASRDFSIFLQGSYCNDTNVYAESDVDVVIRLNETYYSDLEDLPEAEKTSFNQAHTTATYSYFDFKRDVAAWLATKFGPGVKPGDKAIFIPASGSRRNADVLVAAQYRRYYRFRSWTDQSYAEGICFWDSKGMQIVNFPKRHSDNCTIKHKGTSMWLKPTIRVFKNLRNRMSCGGKL